MIEDAAARRRASFAAADRRRKESALTGEQKAERPKPAKPRKIEQQHAPVKKQADRRPGQQRDATPAAVAQKRMAEADRRAEQRRDRLRKEQVRRDFNRQAEDKKATERKQEAAKQEAQKRDAERKAAAQKEAQKRDADRKAAAWVAERQKAQAADALAEQRRQTARLRNQHREENRSLKSNESAALDRHWHAVKRLDAAEQRALNEFDVKRGSLTGRAVELVKGKAHFDAQREDIAKRYESERLHKHRDLEALKERQAETAQATRLRQVHERKAIYDRHRFESREFARAQEAERPRLIEARKQAFNKAAEIEQTHKRERAQQRGQAPELSR